MKPSLRCRLRLALLGLVLPAMYFACSDDKPTNPDPGPDPDAPDPAIAYVTDIAGNSEIYVMDADTTHKTRLTINDSHYYRPVWSPDGTRIAFVSARVGDQTDIYHMQPDGTLPIRLTSDPFNNDYPVWSPDGSKMLYETDLDGNIEIYVIDLTDRVFSNLTNNAAYDGQACWSPDGSRIAFISDRAGIAEVYVMDYDGSDQTRITPGNGLVKSTPDWAPDGSKILYTDDVLGEPRIRWTDSSGTNTQDLTSGSDMNEARARWSPSGERIVFDAQFFSGPAIETIAICICNTDGTGLTTQGVDMNDGNWRFTRSPRWSPDGSLVYYSYNGRICFLDPDGINRTTGTETLSSDPMPDWRPQ